MKPSLKHYFAVVTTVQTPTDPMRALRDRLDKTGGHLLVVGDRKGPDAYCLSETTFLGIQDQLDGPFELAKVLPESHYSRKNIGYLEAMRQGAGCLYETDDDNAPLPSWKLRSEAVPNVWRLPEQTVGWVNIYRHFTSEKQIWPRGLPLSEINSFPPPSELRPLTSDLRSPIQQGLVNGAPDVDAVWRLTQDRPFEFDPRESLWLAPGQWCPFNTQSTWWWPVAYPLLYIPSYCSFRMCDIWKSFVAQRCLWAMGLGVVFHAPEVMQDRNPHDLMKDFADEVPGYLYNARFAEVLDRLDLAVGADAVGDNLAQCYEALIAERFFPQKEASLIETWLKDVATTRTC